MKIKYIAFTAKMNEKEQEIQIFSELSRKYTQNGFQVATFRNV